MAAPLTQLPKLGAFKWNEEDEEAFQRLQNTMITLPVLALPDFSIPFEVETDASRYGIGAVLMRNKRPIAFFSHTLAMRDHAKPVYERELMAMVLAVQWWRPYLLAPMLIDLKVINEEVDSDEQSKEIISKLQSGEEVKNYSMQHSLPKSASYEVILVVVDQFSNYAHFLTLKHPFDAKTVADLFTKEIVRLHGFPQSIVSDRDKIFLSHFWKKLFRLVGTKLNRSIACHPQTDGQTEVVNRSIEVYLCCFCGERPKEWAKWIHWAEYWYNTMYQRPLGVSPFQAVYGRSPPALIYYGDKETPNSTLDEQLKERDITLAALKDHLRVA
ncbi:DNA gyrase subunit A [Cucumis melo var. makuwa]|uniref:DNA gyrase subunit A n=1 Tax=Cucumis melo var. makuwa TaxID=1194695 RepID=A0A5A7UX32_CUCMM|nr:DNA gyrase subunit A [Cucumis melo var. makuwa]